MKNVWVFLFMLFCNCCFKYKSITQNRESSQRNNLTLFQLIILTSHPVFNGAARNIFQSAVTFISAEKVAYEIGGADRRDALKQSTDSFQYYLRIEAISKSWKDGMQMVNVSDEISFINLPVVEGNSTITSSVTINGLGAITLSIALFRFSVAKS